MIKNSKVILEQWIQAVNEKSVKNLENLYDKNAVLIPTFSNRVLDTEEKIQDYFMKLGSREGLSVTLHEKTLRVQEVSDFISIISGIYNWRFIIDDELLNFEARFSYVIDISKENPILHHHSSQIPRML
ncbi:nuclear transport factor 2 family protein [Arcobacter sp. YIC-310]|uniref:nuclear transport factor 2 family protein n=1 Tax=Arcobacter sp. YIC-310 TaxID=3376632 RepID=UPI003C1ABC0D